MSELTTQPKNVRALWVSACPKLTVLQLAGLTTLTSLRINSCCALSQVNGLDSLAGLIRVDLCGCNLRVVRVSCLVIVL